MKLFKLNLSRSIYIYHATLQNFDPFNENDYHVIICDAKIDFYIVCAGSSVIKTYVYQTAKLKNDRHVQF